MALKSSVSSTVDVEYTSYIAPSVPGNMKIIAATREQKKNARLPDISNLFQVLWLNTRPLSGIILSKHQLRSFTPKFPANVTIAAKKDTIHTRFGEKKPRSFPTGKKKRKDTPKSRISPNKYTNSNVEPLFKILRKSAWALIPLPNVHSGLGLEGTNGWLALHSVH